MIKNDDLEEKLLAEAEENEVEDTWRTEFKDTIIKILDKNSKKSYGEIADLIINEL